jgi:hypothetical protein
VGRRRTGLAWAFWNTQMDRRDRAIRAVTLYCGIEEEGMNPIRTGRRSRNIATPVKGQRGCSRLCSGQTSELQCASVDRLPSSSCVSVTEFIHVGKQGPHPCKMLVPQKLTACVKLG